MTIVVQSGVLRTVAAYVGPADLTNLTSPYMWCGLRAYKTSYIASGACVEIYDSSGSFATDIGFGANGLINATAVSNWSAAHSGATPYVKRIYDQTGNNRGFVPNGNIPTNAPTVALTGGPNNGPCLVFSSTAFGSSSTYSNTQPFAISMVYRDPGTVNKTIFSASVAGGDIVLQPGGANPNELLFHAGASITVTSADATWHSVNAFANNTSSFVRLDSTASSPAAGGTNVFSGGTVYLGHYHSGGFNWSGKLVEFGIWNGSVSAEFAALSSNQHTAWGF